MIYTPQDYNFSFQVKGPDFSEFRGSGSLKIQQTKVIHSLKDFKSINQKLTKYSTVVKL